MSEEKNELQSGKTTELKTGAEEVSVTAVSDKELKKEAKRREKEERHKRWKRKAITYTVLIGALIIVGVVIGVKMSYSIQMFAFKLSQTLMWLIPLLVIIAILVLVVMFKIKSRKDDDDDDDD